MAALEEVMGSIFSEKQKETFWNQLGVVIKPHVRSDKYIFISYNKETVYKTFQHYWSVQHFKLLYSRC